MTKKDSKRGPRLKLEAKASWGGMSAVTREDVRELGLLLGKALCKGLVLAAIPE